MNLPALSVVAVRLNPETALATVTSTETMTPPVGILDDALNRAGAAQTLGAASDPHQRNAPQTNIAVVLKTERMKTPSPRDATTVMRA